MAAPPKRAAAPKAGGKAQTKAGPGGRARAPAAPRASGASVAAGLFLVTVGAVLFAIVPALFLVLLTGLSPSILSLFFRPQRGGNFLPTMVALNVAGVIPVVARLWHLGLTQDAAEMLLRDPMMWFLMFGSALLALGLQWALPGMVKAMLDVNAGRQQDRLRKAQAALVAEWGPEVDADRPQAPDEGKVAPGAKPAPAGTAPDAAEKSDALP